MRNRIIALSCLCVLVLNMAGSAVGDVVTKRSLPAQANQLAAMLPPVDGIATIDAKRFFSAALPKLLSANPTLLGKITSGIDEMKTNTGVDVRQFDSIALGFTSAKGGTAKNLDVEPIIIARGQINAPGLIAAAKTASNGKYREENVGDKTIYIFSPKAATVHAKKQLPAGTDPAAVDKVISKASKDIGVTVLDSNTIAFGDIALVRQTISPQKAAVSSELTSLLARKETAIVNFAGKLPGGMSSLVPLDNDELGKNIDSIRLVYGSIDLAGDALLLNVTARTLQDAQAKGLHETLEGLQMIGKAFLGGSKAPDKQVYARLINGAKFSTRANEVIFDLQVAQSDIDILIAGLK